MNKKILLILLGLLIYTRFVGINWGLPYPMHPDERNMVNAIQGLNCDVTSDSLLLTRIKSCFNPNFYAYGQLPLYLAYLLVIFWKFWTVNIGASGTHISFEEATIALRMLSVLSSIGVVLVAYKIIQLILLKSKVNLQKSKIQFKSQKLNQNKNISKLKKRFSTIFNNFQPFSTDKILILILLIFTPYGVQFAHFGTTESLLMLLYLLIIYYCLFIINKQKTTKRNVVIAAGFVGIATGIKLSSGLFGIIPLLLLIQKSKLKNQNYVSTFKNVTKNILIFIGVFGIFYIITSPHNLTNWQDFISSMKYEVSIAGGDYRAFYSRQFEYSIPIIFQMVKVFPYVLGKLGFIIALLGFFGLSWRNKYLNYLRIFFLIYFIPTALLYAKWTRFMSPVFPLLTIFMIIFIIYFFSKSANYIISKLKAQNSKPKLKTKNLLFYILNTGYCILIILVILPGIAYLSIYHNTDIRFKMSQWMYKNISQQSIIIAETGNVINIPIVPPKNQFQDIYIKQYFAVPFDFYNIDIDLNLQNQLQQYLDTAEYIIIPSRRIILNHTCYRFKVQNSKFKNTIQNSKLFNTKDGYQFDRCQKLKEKYPIVNEYYQNLLSGNLGFEEIIEFSSYPKITFLGHTIVEYPDEQAEETWTVFDHPVIRIFKKNSNY